MNKKVIIALLFLSSLSLPNLVQGMNDYEYNYEKSPVGRQIMDKLQELNDQSGYQL